MKVIYNPTSYFFNNTDIDKISNTFNLKRKKGKRVKLSRISLASGFGKDLSFRRSYLHRFRERQALDKQLQYQLS